MVAGPVVIRGKYGGDIHSGRAIHAIAAAGAGHSWNSVKFPDRVVNHR